MNETPEKKKQGNAGGVAITSCRPRTILISIYQIGVCSNLYLAPLSPTIFTVDFRDICSVHLWWKKHSHMSNVVRTIYPSLTVTEISLIYHR